MTPEEHKTCERCGTWLQPVERMSGPAWSHGDYGCPADVGDPYEAGRNDAIAEFKATRGRAFAEAQNMAYEDAAKIVADEADHLRRVAMEEEELQNVDYYGYRAAKLEQLAATIRARKDEVGK